MTLYTPPAGSNIAAGSKDTTSITAENCLAEVATLELVSAETVQNGPHIYDHKGNLVYSGFGHPHLSFYNGQYLIGGGRGHGIIMDSTYRTAATVQSGNGRAPNDIHEFAVLPAIATVFEPAQYDLSAYGVSQPVGWVLEGIFQEIDIQTGEVLFEWRSLDYTDLSESYNERGSLSEGGDGLTIKTA
ncbi:uncharacterized protein K441DRAFT_713633 [Cenococcum geophilum 1.58]|uniref:uncharacterized protein n=1 Tax=Cenococcum geophilum 1.58 TaxID=794803 RepID=UPI00358E9CA8|nr:hypothetical protein K441DRAFT_713633 [Cenococcum geophilum 1.58]